MRTTSKVFFKIFLKLYQLLKSFLFNSPEIMEENVPPPVEETDLKSCSRLVLSEELRRFQQESSIPASLLESL